MIQFSSDVDILKHEPALFGELHFPSQVKAAGTGAVLSGTYLMAEEADFSAAHVTSGQVIYLQSQEGSLDGAYEIVSVDAPIQLTVSVLRGDTADAALAPPAGTDITWRVSTFDPQAKDVAAQLAEYFGLRPGDPAAPYGVEDIMDVEVLRRASALAVISRIYGAWARQTTEDGFWTKSLHYKQQFEKARLRCRLSLDLGANGVADLALTPGSIRLIRG
jgi:hypothetical protein